MVVGVVVVGRVGATNLSLIEPDRVSATTTALGNESRVRLAVLPGPAPTLNLYTGRASGIEVASSTGTCVESICKATSPSSFLPGPIWPLPEKAEWEQALFGPGRLHRRPTHDDLWQGPILDGILPLRALPEQRRRICNCRSQSTQGRFIRRPTRQQNKVAGVVSNPAD